MTTTPDPDSLDGRPATDVLLGSFAWFGRRHLLYERETGFLVLDSTTADGRPVPTVLFERTGRGLSAAWLAGGTELGVTNEQLLRDGVVLRAAALAAYRSEARPLDAALDIAVAVSPRPKRHSRGASV